MKMLILFFLLFPISCISQKKYDYKNIVLEGGGTRGLAYAGVFAVLEQKGILSQLENVGGSSAGAIAGMMISIGYNAAEIDSVMTELRLQRFSDGTWGVFGKYKRFRKKYGVYKGIVFEKWLQNLVKQKTGKPNLTFEELHQMHLKNKFYKDFYCTGTNLSRQRLEIFSYKHTPSVSLALAARISSSIPLYFEPVALDDQMKKVKKSDTIAFINYYVDGGMINNYPISLFDTCDDKTLSPLFCTNIKFNKQTIGIKLERPQQIDSLNNNSTQIPSYNIKNVSQFLGAFSNLLMETLSRKYPGLENEIGRTIYVSQGNIQAQLKKTKDEDKLLLFEYGVKAATDFFVDKE